MVRTRKRVSTTLDVELHKLAVKKNVKWNLALEIGVKKLLGFAGEKKFIQQEIDELQSRVVDLQNRLNSIERMEEEIGEVKGEPLNLEIVLEKVKFIVDKGNLVDYHSLEVWGPEVGLLPDELKNIIRNRYGFVIDDTRALQRNEKREGIDY